MRKQNNVIFLLNLLDPFVLDGLPFSDAREIGLLIQQLPPSLCLAVASLAELQHAQSRILVRSQIQQGGNNTNLAIVRQIGVVDEEIGDDLLQTGLISDCQSAKVWLPDHSQAWVTACVGVLLFSLAGVQRQANTAHVDHRRPRGILQRRINRLGSKSGTLRQRMDRPGCINTLCAGSINLTQVEEDG